MKFFKGLFLIVLLFLVVKVNAQDYGPVNVDLEGYINDRAGEFHKSSNVDETSKKVEKVVAVKPKESVDPIETKKQRERVLVTDETTTPKEPVTPLNDDSNLDWAESKGSNLPLLIGVGASLVIITLFVVLTKAGKKKRIQKTAMAQEDSSSLSEKIAANEKALMAETQMEPIQSSSGSVKDPNFVPHNAQEMADKFASETKVDDRGRNPSGLIIDEDKYFQSGASNFIDEDFEG